MKKLTPKIALCREYIQKHPKLPTQTIARLIIRDYPGLFRTLTNARGHVQYVRGERNPNCASIRTTVGQRTPAERHGLNQWTTIPEPEKDDFEYIPLPEHIRKWLVMADVHIPFHDRSALMTIFQYAQDVGIDGVLWDGDILDFYQVSSFTKDPRIAQIEDEFKTAEIIIDIVREQLRPKAFVWKFANHEERLERYLFQRAPALVGLLENFLSVPTILDFKRRGITYVKPGMPITLQELTILHGDEHGTRFSSPVNPARGAFLKGHACILSAHEHKTSDHNDPDVRDRLISCWSIGCACQLHPKYRRIPKWNHGFAILNNDPKTGWSIENKRIIKGKVR